MRRFSIFGLLLLVLLASCSQLSGNNGLSGTTSKGSIVIPLSRSVTENAPLNVEAFILEIHVNDILVLDKTIKKETDNDTFENIVAEGIPTGECAITLTAKGTDKKTNKSVTYMGITTATIEKDKTTSVKIKMELVEEESEETDTPAKEETVKPEESETPSKEETTTYTPDKGAKTYTMTDDATGTEKTVVVSRNVDCTEWYADSTGTFTLKTIAIKDHTTLFNATVDGAEATVFAVQVSNNLNWDKVGNDTCTVIVKDPETETTYSVAYPIVHKYLISEPDLYKGNVNVTTKNGLGVSISAKENGSISIYEGGETSNNKQQQLSSISHMELTYNISNEAGFTKTVQKSFNKLNDTVEISIEDMGITENGTYSVTIKARQVVDADYQKYFYNNPETENSTNPLSFDFTVAGLE